MSNFLKYMRLFALGITFSSSMALPYVQIKFYDVFREATQASNNELGLLMTIFTAVSMALYIPGGVLADRGSPKKLLLLSLIMMCGLNAYFAFHTSYGAAQLIWALLAIAANTVQWPRPSATPAAVRNRAACSAPSTAPPASSLPLSDS